MSNQRRLWNDPVIRAERQAKVELLTSRPMELDPITPEPTPMADISNATTPRARIENVLAIFKRLAPRIGELAAMESAMEEHDRTRDRAAEVQRKVAAGQRREERRA